MSDLTDAEREALRQGFEDAVQEMGIADVLAIIRELGKVEAEPMVYVKGDDMTDGYWVCGLCEVHANNVWVAPFHNDWEHIPHAEFCLWRRAREWVDTHPEPRPQTFSDMAPGWRL